MRSRDPLANPAEAIRRVYAYVAYRVGPGPDAEDVTSEVIERAIRYRSSYDSRRGAPLGWLIGIARTCVDDLYRNRLHGLGNQHEPADPAEMETDSLQRLELAAAVATLEPRDRELIALRYGADLGTRQIALMLEMAPNAVDVALHRARARLRAELREAGYGERRTMPKVTSQAAPQLSPD
jgi:RNA polymerase sigma factor (sigma-70 family)